MNAFHRIVQLWGSRITKINYQCPREILCSNWLPSMELWIPLRAASSSPRYLVPQLPGCVTLEACRCFMTRSYTMYPASKALGVKQSEKVKWAKEGDSSHNQKEIFSRILRKRFSEIIQRRITFVPQQFNIAEKNGSCPSFNPVSTSSPCFLSPLAMVFFTKKNFKSSPKISESRSVMDFHGFSHGFPHRFSP